MNRGIGMTVGITEALDVIGKRWKTIASLAGALLVAALWVVWVTGGVNAGEAKDTEQDTVLERIEKLSAKLDTRMDGIDMNLGLILQLYGIDKDKVNRWRRIPGSPVLDTLTGKPTLGAKWIKLSEDHARAWLYCAEWDTETDEMIIVESLLFDLRKI